MANIYALLGDADHAIPILKRLLQTPYAGAIVSYSGYAATRSDLGSNPQRSAFSRIGGGNGAVARKIDCRVAV